MSDIEYNAQAVIEHLTAQKYKVTVERDRLIDDKISLIAQRDKLLAALKEIAAYWKDAESLTETDREAAKTTYETAVNAIAKCEAQS